MGAVCQGLGYIDVSRRFSNKVYNVVVDAGILGFGVL